MLLQKKTNHQTAKKGNRLLISIAVLGSAGPIRFVVNEEDLVAAVIDTALKSYAREGRLPVLGSHDIGDFMLYCPCGAAEALSPWETIGSVGFRNFKLCKKPQPQNTGDDGKQKQSLKKSSHRALKVWFTKSVPSKVPGFWLEFARPRLNLVI